LKISRLLSTFVRRRDQIFIFRQIRGGLPFFRLHISRSFAKLFSTKRVRNKSLRLSTTEHERNQADWTMKQIETIRGNAFVLNFLALLIFGVLYGVVYKLLWDVQIPEERPDIITLIIFLFGLIVVHEGIHGAAALLFIDRQRISFSVKWLVVICKVDGMMTRGQYLFYALAPAALLGLIGIVFHYVAGSVEQRFFAALLFLGGVSGGGGDFWFAGQVVKYPKECLVIDRGIEIEVYTNDSTEDSGGMK
jgi:hypothetical protein